MSESLITSAPIGGTLSTLGSEYRTLNLSDYGEIGSNKTYSVSFSRNLLIVIIWNTDRAIAAQSGLCVAVPNDNNEHLCDWNETSSSQTYIRQLYARIDQNVLYFRTSLVNDYSFAWNDYGIVGVLL